MSISQADLQTIATVFDKKTDEISSAISQEGEVSLGLKLNGRVISQEDEKTLKDTIRAAGVEIGFKQIAKEAGFDLSPEDKDAKVIADKLKVNITTALEDKYRNPQPGEKEKELTEKLESEQLKYNKLLKTHETTSKEIEEWQTKYQTKEKEIKTKERNNSILKHFPDKMKQDRSDALLIFVNTFEFDESDGKQVVKRNGEIVTDSVGKPEVLENIVSSFVEEKNWIKGSGMNGNDRNSGSKKGGRTPEEAQKVITEKLGVGNEATPEGIKMFRELTATE